MWLLGFQINGIIKDAKTRKRAKRKVLEHKITSSTKREQEGSNCHTTIPQQIPTISYKSMSHFQLQPQ